MKGFKKFFWNANPFLKSIILLFFTVPFSIIYSKTMHYLLYKYYDVIFPYPFENDTFLRNFFSAVLLAPFVETIIFQLFLIQVLHKVLQKIKINIKYKTFINCFISAISFSLAHVSNHKFYPILVFPIGLLLSYVFLKALIKYNNFYAFKLTFYFHALYNFTALLTEYILP